MRSSRFFFVSFYAFSCVFFPFFFSSAAARRAARSSVWPCPYKARPRGARSRRDAVPVHAPGPSGRPERAAAQPGRRLKVTPESGAGARPGPPTHKRHMPCAIGLIAQSMGREPIAALQPMAPALGSSATGAVHSIMELASMLSGGGAIARRGRPRVSTVWESRAGHVCFIL